MNNITCDDILYDKLTLLQPQNGPRVNLDTILLSAWVKVRSRHSRFIEAGCATGAISLLLAMKHPHIHVTGVDIQPDLITLAAQNAINNNLDGKTSFITGDIRDKDIFPRESFDGFIINPPYESPSRGRISPDPSRSTARHELTCTPDDVGEAAYRLLKCRGRLFTVFTSGRLDVFITAMRNNRLMPKRLRPVYPRMNAQSGVFLLECVKDGGEGMILLPPLYVRGQDDKYTPEVLGAYDIHGEGK